MKFVKKKKRPHVFRYDDIVPFTHKGKEGFYMDGMWFKEYNEAFNFRRASILGG